MTFTNTANGTMRVTCNGGCKTELLQTPANKGVNLLDFMRSAGWIVGPNLCPDCADGREKASAAGWDDVEEASPGIWVQKAVKAPVRRRRKIRKLL